MTQSNHRPTRGKQFFSSESLGKLEINDREISWILVVGLDIDVNMKLVHVFVLSKLFIILAMNWYVRRQLRQYNQ